MDFELDPERAVWKPTRRFFLMGLGAALVAPSLPRVEIQAAVAPVEVMSYFSIAELVARPLTELDIVRTLERIKNAGSLPQKIVVGEQMFEVMSGVYFLDSGVYDPVP